MFEILLYVLLGLAAGVLLLGFSLLIFIDWVFTTKTNIKLGIYANDRFSDKHILQWIEKHTGEIKW